MDSVTYEILQERTSFILQEEEKDCQFTPSGVIYKNGLGRSCALILTNQRLLVFVKQKQQNAFVQKYPLLKRLMNEKYEIVEKESIFLSDIVQISRQKIGLNNQIALITLKNQHSISLWITNVAFQETVKMLSVANTDIIINNELGLSEILI